MKTKWLASLILASAITAPAFAQVGIYIGHEPPPLRYEVRPAMPGSGLCLGRWILELVGGKVCLGPRSMAQASLCERVLDPSSLRPLRPRLGYNEGHWDHDDHRDHHDWDHDSTSH